MPRAGIRNRPLSGPRAIRQASVPSPPRNTGATIYAGSGQYLGVDLLANASPLGDAAFLTLMINFRHLVYGLSMLEKAGFYRMFIVFQPGFGYNTSPHQEGLTE